MASAETQEKVAEVPATSHEAGKVVEAPPPEPEKAAPPPEVKKPGDAPPTNYFALGDVLLRFLLFASALVAVVLMVTSKQTEKVPLPFPPFTPVPRTAKFNHSAAFIYFVAAFSVAGLYALITTLLSFYALLKPGCSPKVLSHLIILDVLLLGIVASATGTAGAVGYIGLKGNSHVLWTKVCNVYDTFCKHVGASVAVALFGSVVLTLLILLSVYSLSKKIPK